MSSGFAGSNTRGMSALDREIESRLSKMDKFTDEFNPPGGFYEHMPYQDVSKPDNNYQAPHDDIAVSEKKLSTPQEELDRIDFEEHQRNAPAKEYDEQFPGAVLKKTLSHLAAGVDEAKWEKAKEKSKEQYGRIKWPFVNWLYERMK